MELIDYRQTSSKFRRLSSRMLMSTYEEENLHLIRLRLFMDKDKIIQKILSERITNIAYDCKENDFICIEDGYWAQLNPPIDEEEHIKAIYDYLVEMTQKEQDLTDIAHRFRCKSKSLTDIVRHYLEVVFKPLVDYIISVLTEEMMYMENKNNKSAGMVVNQNIQNNYGANNFAQGNITSNNTVDLGAVEKEDIKTLIADIIEMIKVEDIEQDVKDEILDELEVINEQIESESPKQTRIRKACKGVKEFICNLPTDIGTMTNITLGLTKLIESIEGLEVMIK